MDFHGLGDVYRKQIVFQHVTKVKRANNSRAKTKWRKKQINSFVDQDQFTGTELKLRSENVEQSN